ncbi:MAG: HAD family phosphatase [Pyrinomonadaceae bacterium]|nr:HAD family phosphatase [Pyrinomonadaceae bacterium]
MIRSLFFDFNGVIIDDEPIQLKAYQQVLSAEGITLTEAEYYDALGMDDVTFVRAAFARAGKALADETLGGVIERKTQLHHELFKDELPLFPGAATFVKAASYHFGIALVSMARRVEIEHVLEGAGLTGVFDVIVSAEDVNACKPDPASYNLAFKLMDDALSARGELHISPEDCLAIEDAPPGIIAARRAGMRTLGIINTVKEEALRAAGAEVVTKNLADWTPDAVHHVFD